MISKLLTLFYELKKYPVGVTLFLSLCLSFQQILLHPVLNNDAYIYLHIAAVAPHEGLLGVLAHYGWYSYGVFIAYLDAVLPGSTIFAGHCLNTVLYLLLSYQFLCLNKNMGQTSTHLWIAALLFLSLPLVNNLRYFFIRDIGYWAFALWSINLLLQYRQYNSSPNIFCWLLSVILAVSFRLEGILLLILPLILYERTNRKPFLRFYGILLGVTLILLGLLQLFEIDLLALIRFAWRYYLPGFIDIWKVTNLVTLPENLSIVLFNLVQGLSAPLTAILLVLAFKKKLFWQSYWASVLALALFLNLLILLVFQEIMHFQTERYAGFAVILLLALLANAMNNLKEEIHIFWQLGFGILLMLLLLDSMVSFGPGKMNRVNAVHWLKSELSLGTTLITNDFYIAYSSGMVDDYVNTEIDPIGALNKFEQAHPQLIKNDEEIWVALVYGKEVDPNSLNMQGRGLNLVKSFQLNGEDQVFIFFKAERPNP